MKDDARVVLPALPPPNNPHWMLLYLFGTSTIRIESWRNSKKKRNVSLAPQLCSNGQSVALRDCGVHSARVVDPVVFPGEQSLSTQTNKQTDSTDKSQSLMHTREKNDTFRKSPLS
jgi:hypothetical protein